MRLLLAFAALAACGSPASAAKLPAVAAPAASAPHASDLEVETKLRLWAGELKLAPAGKPAPATTADKAGAQPIPAGFSAEDRAGLRDAPASPIPQAVPAAPPSLRREITIADAAEKSRLEGRLPGMAEDPFDVCRTLENCAVAPTSFHVEDEALIPDALVALSRPWIALEKARGRRLLFTPTGGSGEKIATLEVSSGRLEIHAAPAPTGGYDVWLVGTADPAKRFEAEKEIVLQTFR